MSDTVQVDCIPTSFALMMARSVELYTEPDIEFPQKLSDHDRLEMFQSVSITGTFEESLAAGYFGKNINNTQVVILKTIHALTSKWLIGKLSQNLINRLDLLVSLNDKGKDVSDLAGRIVELLGISKESKQVSANKKSRFVLEIVGEQEGKKSRKKSA